MPPKASVVKAKKGSNATASKASTAVGKSPKKFKGKSPKRKPNEARPKKFGKVDRAVYSCPVPGCPYLISRSLPAHLRGRVHKKASYSAEQIAKFVIGKYLDGRRYSIPYFL